MTCTRTFWSLRAFLKRDLENDLSYKLSFALEAAHVVIAVAAFFFLAELVGDKRPEGHASFPFILVGMTVNAYMTTCFVCFSQAIRGSQTGGTLKAILATPATAAGFLIGSSTYPFIRASFDAAVYIAAGTLFGFSALRMNAWSGLVIFALSLLAFGSIGVISASFVLLFKRGDPLLWLFGSTSWLLGGVLYPTDLLPLALQRVAQCLPITHAVNGMRAALLTGASPGAIVREITALGLFAVIGFPLSLVVFNIAVQHAKYTGTLDHR